MNRNNDNEQAPNDRPRGVSDPVENRHHKVLVLFIIVFTLFAWSHRFISDDAFISFRYAENLVKGAGLTWNPEEQPVEGYTNFLWTLMMCFPIVGGWDPVLFSQLFGLIFFILSLWFTYKLSFLIYTY